MYTSIKRVKGAQAQMKFRPCIDIHNGKVRQIVGSSLRDEGDLAKVNFTAEGSAADFALFHAALQQKLADRPRAKALRRPRRF